VRRRRQIRHPPGAPPPDLTSLGKVREDLKKKFFPRVGSIRLNGLSLVEARRVTVGVLELVLKTLSRRWPTAFAKRTTERIRYASSSFAVSR
jgi:hypothetical protein